ncbi:MAG TPA: hypothetical protein VNO43_17155 [Candidatus Eisenbacteria bacterium]|nr:hypothetical protein [Candidatus Eisenbacteria bacterium]
MGRWKWFNVLMVTLVPLLCFLVFWKPYFDPASFGTTLLGPEKIGDWVVVLGTSADYPLAHGTEIKWRARFCDGCYEQLRSSELALGDAEGPLWPATALSGTPYTLAASLATPANFPPAGLYIWLTVEDLNGLRYRRSWFVSR